MVISFKKVRLSFDSVEIDSLPFEIVSATKVMEVPIRRGLKWIDHVEDVTIKAAKRLYLLRQLKRADVATDDHLGFYCSVIRQFSNMHANCFIAVFPNIFPTILNVSSIQVYMCTIVPNLSYRDALNRTKIPTLSERWEVFHSNYLKTLLEINTTSWPHCLLRSQLPHPSI